MNDRPRTTDVLIVGGGPAGLAAAIALRQKGIDCLVVDALMPPIEKGCGEGLMPGTLRSLARLGVVIDPNEGFPFSGIAFSDPAHRVTASFPDGTGVGIRRTHLHERMHDRARTLGARFAWGSHVQLDAAGRVRVAGEALRFDWLIGADGTSSRVRTWAGLSAAHRLSQRFGHRRHYRIAPWSEHVEIYWGERGQIYVTPVAQDQVCLVYIAREAENARGDFLSDFPTVARRLRNAAIITPARGALSATRRLRRVTAANVALLGDASGSVDAITGEGLAMTFQQADAVAASLAGGGLAEYSTAHHNIGSRPHLMSSLMLAMDRWSWVRQHGLRMLAAEPGLFSEFLAVHVGQESLPAFILRRSPSMAWSLLAGCTAPVSFAQPPEIDPTSTR